MDIRAAEISDIIRKQIENYDKKVSVTETGTVLTAGDGIARVYGLSGALAGGPPGGGERPGRVPTAIGVPIDGEKPIATTVRRQVELKAPGIIQRKSVHE